MDYQHNNSLKEEIIRLISLKQEGGYWDFKRQWYESNKKCDLLHDIICMANNLQNRDAYIIIGVDEENDYSIVDVKNDPMRKKTQMIVDFLKGKKFAGGIRPLVHVDHISLRSGDVDVIVIENSHYTPFYLTDRFEGVIANHIYTRVVDSNTPIDKSADINHVEHLWRKRFRIDETPVEKFRYYLINPCDWENVQDFSMEYFYKYSPEYTIITEKDDSIDGYEYYMFGQINIKPNWWRITLKFHQTAIEQFQGIALDGGRSFVVAPYRAYDLFEAGISPVGYYIDGDLRSRLLDFFHQKETVEEYPYRKYVSIMLFFSSQKERDLFFDYVLSNLERYHELYAQQGDTGLPRFPDFKGYNMDEYKKDYCDALVLQKMLSEYRMSVEFSSEI